MTNPNSSHVIVKIITSINENNIVYLFDIIRKNLLEISQNQYGCSSIQKCIEVSPKSQKEMFIQKITRHTNELILDNYGNYVLLNIVSMKNQEAIRNIIDNIIASNNLNALCKSKVSSCVIEKCMDNTDDLTRNFLMSKFSTEDIIDLVLDPQGFYSK